MRRRENRVGKRWGREEQGMAVAVARGRGVEPAAMMWSAAGAGAGARNLRAGSAVLSFLHFGGVLCLRARGEHAHRTLRDMKFGWQTTARPARSR